MSLSSFHEYIASNSTNHDRFEVEQGNNLERSSLVYRAYNIGNTFKREHSLSIAYGSFQNEFKPADDE